MSLRSFCGHYSHFAVLMASSGLKLTPVAGVLTALLQVADLGHFFGCLSLQCLTRWCLVRHWWGTRAGEVAGLWAVILCCCRQLLHVVTSMVTPHQLPFFRHFHHCLTFDFFNSFGWWHMLVVKCCWHSGWHNGWRRCWSRCLSRLFD